MKCPTIKKITLLFCWFLFVFPFINYSHPLDISYTKIVPRPNEFHGETYIHPYELILLFRTSGIKFHNEQDFEQLTDHLIPYFIKNFQVFANGEVIEFQHIKLRQKSFAGILSDGVNIHFDIPRKAGSQIYQLKITLFIEYFETQTNKLLLLDQNGEVVDGRPEICFTKYRQEWELNLNKPDFSQDIDDQRDSDKDGLTNHQEKLYGTDSLVADTDKDGFSDYEEFVMGWNPLKRRSNKGQYFSYLKLMDEFNLSYKNVPGFSDSARLDTGLEYVVISNPQYHNTQVQKEEKDSTAQPVHPLFSSPNSFLSNFYEKTSVVNNSVSKGLIFGFIFLLGLFHVSTFNFKFNPLLKPFAVAQIPLHSALINSLLFAMTHVLDILLAILVSVFIYHTDNWNYWSPVLQVGFWFGLFIFILIYVIQGSYRLFAGKKSRRSMSEFNQAGNNQTGSSIARWFKRLYYSLKPFSLKWIILLYILSIGKTELSFFWVSALALGILCSLILYQIGIRYFSKKVNPIYNLFNYFSVLFSGIMLVLIFVKILFPAIS